MPVSFAIEALRIDPDPAQVEALTHFADKPESIDDYVAVYEGMKARYRHAAEHGEGEEKRIAAFCLQVAERRWTPEWYARNYADVFKRVSMQSGHGIGKTTTLAICCVWMLVCFFPCKIGTTAPTSHQLEDVLWSEIGMLYRRLPEYLQSKFNMTQLRLAMKSRPEESFAVGRTARRDQPEALQGLHSKHTGVVVDEATGVDDAVFTASGGILTSPGSRAIMGANPTRLQGFFFDSHDRTSHLWHCMTVSCFDSPRVAPEYIEEIKARYGEHSNTYRVRVLGLPPRGDDDAVIPAYMVEDAVNRPVEAYEDAPMIWGVDPARFGDDRTTVAFRHGNVKPSQVLWWEKQDTMQTADRVYQLWCDTPERLKPLEVVVDVIGIGAGVADRLRQLGLPVLTCNVADAPTQPEKYPKLYDELWFSCRQWFEHSDCRIDEDRAFIRELTRPTYKPVSNGMFRVERKEEVKARTQELQSPDLAEAFILTFYGRSGVRARSWNKRKLQYRRLGVV